MNNKKTLLLSIILFMITQTSFAQLYSAGFQFSKISGGWAIKNIGIHATGEYQYDDKTGLVGSLGYFLPNKFDNELTLYAGSSTVNPHSITLITKDKTTGFQISAMGKRFFVNEYEEEGFGFYGLAGIGLCFFTVKSDIPDYNKSDYGASEEYEKTNGSGFTLNFGLGAQVQTKSGMIYFEPILNIPATSAGGQAVDVEIPTTLQFNLGYRFIL